MSKISVHGFYGEGNLGDEAILRALLLEMRRFPGAKPVVFSKYPAQVALDHGVRSISERGARRPRGMWEIATSRLVVLGGGGLLKDYGDGSANIRRWLRIIAIAQRMRRRTALWAVGADDISRPESKELIRAALSRVDFISVRDEDSREALRSCGVEGGIFVAADPALLLVGPDAEGGGMSGFSPRVAVSVRSWFRRGPYVERPDLNEKALRALGGALDSLIDECDATVDFVPFRTTAYDDDRRVARAVIAGMRRHERASLIEAAPDMDGLVPALSRYSMMIGMRLHAIIFAAALGLPVIGLEYAPKVRAFMKSIAQEEYSLPLETISREALRTIISASLARRDERSRLIRARVSALREKVRQSVEMLAVLAGMETGRSA